MSPCAILLGILGSGLVLVIGLIAWAVCFSNALPPDYVREIEDDERFFV